MSTLIEPSVLSVDEASQLLDDLDAGRLRLPVEIAAAIRTIITELKDGNDVTISASSAELPTAEAATLLNVSRPHVVDLADSGALPHHKVGTHRLLKMADVLDYKQRRDAASRSALAEIHELADDTGMDL